MIRQDAIKTAIQIDDSDIIKIRGVTDTPIYSIGSMQLALIFNQYTITHKFHVVPNNFAIPSHGLIGKDFNRLYECILDYGSMTYTVRTKLGQTILSMSNYNHENEITVPPRSEIFRIFNISSNIYPIFVNAKEIKEGVFSANTIAFSNTAEVRLVNTTNSFQTFKIPKFDISDLKLFNIYTMTEINNCKERNNKLLEILNNAFPKNESLKSKLKQLCSDYSDIFALDTDQMTTNNFYEQHIKTTDNSPVFTRNYRTPHSQKEEINRQVQKLLDNKLIENSTSDFNSPIILVPKKGSGIEKKMAPMHRL